MASGSPSTAIARACQVFVCKKEGTILLSNKIKSPVLIPKIDY